MSFFDSFLGSAAEAGAGILSSQMKQEQSDESAKRLAIINEDLAVQRAKTIAANKRAMDLQAGQEISAASSKIGNDRKNLALGDAQNDPEINGVQSVDSKSDLQKAGILSSRAQDLDDRATASENLGYLDQAKETRGQQQLELSRVGEDRRTTALENQAKSAAKLAEIKQQHEDNLSDRNIAWQQAQSDKNDTANRRIEAMIAKSSSKASADPEAKERMQFLAAERGTQISLSKEMSDLENSSVNIRPTIDGKPNPDFVQNRAAKAELSKQLAQSRKMTSALSTALADKLGIAVKDIDSATNPDSKTPATPTAKDALPMPNVKSALVVGKTYQTPRGIATWDGSQFTQ